MKWFALLLVLGLFVFPSQANAQCPESFHDFQALDINGDTLQMSSFAGKKLLVVNTASFCGYTPQYGQLQDLYDNYGGSNFEIIGFPANNFGSQEPYNEDSIIKVCNSYNVTFTMMSKISVKGANMHPIYQWLTQASRNCVQNASVNWNFQKFMINADGSWHGVRSSSSSPLSSVIVDWITAPASIQDEIVNPIDNLAFYQSGSSIRMKTNTDINERVCIRLLNLAGQQVATIFEGKLTSKNQISYSTVSLNKGMYIIEITGKGILSRKKLMLL